MNKCRMPVCAHVPVWSRCNAGRLFRNRRKSFINQISVVLTFCKLNLCTSFLYFQCATASPVFGFVFRLNSTVEQGFTVAEARLSFL